jgi:SAM-dependent methyltransferase
MDETRKATERRLKESIQVFNWNDVFHGNGIDVGPGDDLMKFGSIVPQGFDMGDGDANRLSEYFPEGHFDFLHASQCLEHMHDPYYCIGEWAKVVKPGGHLIITVPDFVLYEGLRHPSRWNPDHKSSWSLHLKGSPYGRNHVLVGGYLWEHATDAAGLKPVLTRLVDTNFDYSRIGSDFDQTFNFEDRVECFLEMVYLKG